MEPNSISCMVYRVKKDEYSTHDDVVQNNLHPDGTKFNIHVNRNVVIFFIYEKMNILLIAM